MGTTTLRSLAEFERLDGPEHLELLHGELIRMPPAERRHNNVARTLFLLVHAAIERRRADSSERVGRAEVEMGYLLSTDPPSWLQPDVSISGAGQPGEKYFEGAPLVAVEVVSQSDAAAHLEAKVLSHLAHGSAEVWVIYPEQRHVRIHYADGSSSMETQTIRTKLLPQAEFPLTEILG